jgi:phage gp46-like protein
MDVAILNKGLCFDLNFLNGDLEADPSLENAVIISIFTDRRVTDEQLPIAHTSKRGWWGDMYPDVDLDKIGSRLWTINPDKVLTETLRKSEDYCSEALAWMIEDGLADAINVNSEYNLSRHLIINIEIVKPGGLSSRYEILWNEQKLRRG